MKTNSINNISNFTSVYRKVHTREPYLIQEILPPYDINNSITLSLLGQTNSEINNQQTMTQTQQELHAIEFDKLIRRQNIARNRDGNILNRLMDMDKKGYSGICKSVSADVLCALTKLKAETISSLNDFQLYRICECESGNRKTADGLAELEKEFSTEELQRISERDNSTIINTWINKNTNSDEGFECLTKYIHKIAKK